MCNFDFVLFNQRGQLFRDRLPIGLDIADLALRRQPSWYLIMLQFTSTSHVNVLRKLRYFQMLAAVSPTDVCFNRIGMCFWRALPSWSFASSQITPPLPRHLQRTPFLGRIFPLPRHRRISALAGTWWTWGRLAVVVNLWHLPMSRFRIFKSSERMPTTYLYIQGVCGSWKIVEKSWKIKQIVAVFVIVVHVFFYLYMLSLLTIRFGSTCC